MTSPIQDIRAMLLQFQQSPLKDLYFRSADWSMFMARPGGVDNPLLAVGAAESEPVTAAAAQVAASAPHLGLFEPHCAVGDLVAAGAVVAVIDVLGRKTDVVSKVAGRVARLCFAANDLAEYGEALLEVEAA